MAVAENQEAAIEFPWWIVLIQGVAALVLGLLLLSSPGITSVVLVQFLGIYWMISGIFQLVAIFVAPKDMPKGWLAFSGILGIIAGIVILQHPLWASVIVGVTLVFMLGIYGIFGGAISLYHAFKGAGWAAGILGAISILFGLVLILNHWIAALSLPWVIGIFGVIGGIVAIWQSFKLRSAEKALEAA